MRNILRTIIGAISLSILIISCVTPGTKPSAMEEASAPPLVDQYMTRAQEHESSGNLVEALDQYNLVLTVDPENTQATQKINQIRPKLDNLAEEHYRTGLSFHQKGEYARARQEFLTALRYNPDHAAAADILKDHELGGKRVKGYLPHTIQPDESISMLAQRYYGDYRKFHIIAEFNRLEDATKVKAGQQIRIPVVEDLPFYARPEDITTPPDEEAEATLEEVVPVKRYIVHTVQPEESLSKLALRYYGDYKKFPMIAQYNHMPENANLRVGQEIRIPEVEGVPLIESPEIEEPKEPQTQQPDPQQPVSPMPAPEVTAPDEEAKPQKISDFDDQVANYRELGMELFKEKNYSDAIIELNKILTLYPNDPMATEYTSRAHFEQGKLIYAKGKYGEALSKFEEALKFNSQCPECRTYINRCREKQQEQVRAGAMDLFNKKKYKAAIAEFNRILEQYPNDPVVLEYLSAAHFQQGLILFGKEDYLTSRDEFKASLRNNEKCDKCLEYIKKSEDTYKECHYNRGLSYFRKEMLNDAVREWELTYKVDPEYKDVAGNLKKARGLQERLESIKRSKMKGGKN